MNEQRPFIEPRNPFYLAMENQRRATRKIAKEVANIAIAPSETPVDHTVEVLHAIKERLESIDRTIGRLDSQAPNIMTALYAVAVGPHGGISHHSQAGKWVQAAWVSTIASSPSPLTICDIAQLKAVQKRTALFNALVKTKTAAGPGFEHLTDTDVLRFMNEAASVCALIEADDAPSEPDPQPDPTVV